MNTLPQNDVRFFYETFRTILDFSNRHFHLDDKVDFLHDDSLDPNFCKKAVDMVWENPSVIDDLLQESGVPEEQRSLLESWKHCVHDLFFVERHLKNGAIFISSHDKVYQVLGLNGALEDLFSSCPQPTVLEATLLPFGDVIITDGLYDIKPVYAGPGIKANLKDIYMQAKRNNAIIRQLPETAPKNETPRAAGGDPDASERKKKSKAAPKNSSGQPVSLYHLKVYPKGNGRSVYRMIDISGNATLAKLCTTILDAFDFDAEHMYEFCMDNKMYSHNSYQSEPVYDDRSVKVRLDTLHLAVGQNFSLHYDFGDDWMFVIHVDSIENSAQPIEPHVTRSKGYISQYW